MKCKVAAALVLLSTAALAADGDRAVPPRIGWYGALQSGLAEARRSGRPILLVSGAPQCLGVSGIW